MEVSMIAPENKWKNISFGLLVSVFLKQTEETYNLLIVIDQEKTVVHEEDHYLSAIGLAISHFGKYSIISKSKSGDIILLEFDFEVRNRDSFEAALTRRLNDSFMFDEDFEILNEYS